MLLRNQLLVRAIDAVTHQWRQRIVGLHVILLDDRLLMKVILQARRLWTFSVTVQRKPRFFKIITIDDVTLWSKLESIWSVYSNLLILFHRRTIFKMLTLEQSAESALLVPGGGRPTAPTPLTTGLIVRLSKTCGIMRWTVTIFVWCLYVYPSVRPCKLVIQKVKLHKVHIFDKSRRFCLCHV